MTVVVLVLMRSSVSYYSFLGAYSPTRVNLPLPGVSDFQPQRMTFSFPQSLRGSYPRDNAVTCSLVASFDRWYVSDENILIAYACGNHFSYVIHPTRVEFQRFLVYVCALDAQLERSVHGRLSERDCYVHGCGIHWAVLGGRTSFP